MKFACPKCEKEVSLIKAACPHCQFPLTFWAVLKHYCQELRLGVKQAAAIQCPTCSQAAPIYATTCPHCGTVITLDKSVDVVSQPNRRRWRAFVDEATPATARKVRAVYFLVSAVLLWGLLAYVQGHLSEQWVLQAALALGYLVLLSLVTVVIVTLPRLQALFQRAKPLVKLGVLCNYLTVPLLLHILVGAWWESAVGLAVVIGGTVAAVILFRLIASAIWPPQNERRPFDVTAPQGRRGRYD